MAVGDILYQIFVLRKKSTAQNDDIWIFRSHYPKEFLRFVKGLYILLGEAYNNLKKLMGKRLQNELKSDWKIGT